MKEFELIDFPFTIANEKQADALLDGPFGKALLDTLPAKGWSAWRSGRTASGN